MARDRSNARFSAGSRTRWRKRYSPAHLLPAPAWKARWRATRSCSPDRDEVAAGRIRAAAFFAQGAVVNRIFWLTGASRTVKWRASEGGLQSGIASHQQGWK